jgi:glutaredoxin 3
MSSILMYSTTVCPYCTRAEFLLQKKGITHIEKIWVDHQPDKMQHMIKITGRRTVPQIFINDVHVGGYDDLARLDRMGRLDEMLQA